SGTRITVELILENLGAGEIMEQIIEAHPRLIREAILAASANALRADLVYPTPSKVASSWSQMRASIARSSKPFVRLESR
ncbi:MAG: DUF433 domain-containing protein, partial [Gammaproteobacteria bacterium]